jgi:hypothetical protein
LPFSAEHCRLVDGGDLFKNNKALFPNRLTCGVALAAAMTFVGCGGASEKTAKQESPAQSVSSGRLPKTTAKSIDLPAGTTSLVFEGQLAAGENAEYVISAEQGSLLMAHALAPETDLKVAVYRMDTGERLEDEHKNVSFWKKRMPATLGYLVEVQGISKPTDYALEIEVPRAVQLDEQTKAQAIKSSAPQGASVAYVIPNASSRTLSIKLQSAAGAYLSLSGLDDGNKLLSSAANAQSFSGKLMGTQDYLLRVYSGAKSGDFTLDITSD